MNSKSVTRERLALLKQHHDELDRFFQQIQSDLDQAYGNYKGVAIVADVIADLVFLSITAYKSVVLGVEEISKWQFAKRALQFAYVPITSVLTELSGPTPDVEAAARRLAGFQNLLLSASNIAGNVLAPSYWAGVVSNMKSGYWQTAFVRNPAAEIILIRSGLKRQRAEALENMERQINQMEQSLGVPATIYMCKV
jgi:hypothetical protein